MTKIVQVAGPAFLKRRCYEKSKYFIDKLRTDLVNFNKMIYKSLGELIKILKYVEVNSDYLRRLELFHFVFEDATDQYSLVEVPLDFISYYTFDTSVVEGETRFLNLYNETTQSTSTPKIQALTYYGFNVSINEILKQMTPINENIQLLQIHAINKVILDQEFTLYTNLSIISPLWEFSNKSKIDLSGKKVDQHGYDIQKPHPDDNGATVIPSQQKTLGAKGNKGANGWTGFDGTDGVDGRSLLGLAESFAPLCQLKVCSSGSNGGDAQNGQNGGVGQEGGAMGDGFEWFGATTHGSGGNGGNGGNAGKRGSKGYKGNIILSPILNSAADISNNDGDDGKAGKGGSGGAGGSGGLWGSGDAGLKGSDSPDLDSNRVSKVKPVSYYSLVNYEQTLVYFLYKKKIVKDIAFNLLHDIIAGVSPMFEVGKKLGIHGLLEELMLIHECLYSHLFDAKNQRICLSNEEVVKLYKAFFFKLLNSGTDSSKNQLDSNALIGLCSSAFSALKTLQSSYTIINLNLFKVFC